MLRKPYFTGTQNLQNLDTQEKLKTDVAAYQTNKQKRGGLYNT